ncbi:MAG TPA: CpsB/CapC family capsule biosynthesis tyrosine phosphatase, partial [Armatimonadota bacterium]
WVLLEMPFGALPARLPDLLAGLGAAGLRTLVAHPERCAAFQRDPCLLDRFFPVDVPLQITAGSLMGRFGPAARKCALQMVRTPHPIVVASDAHDPLLRAPVLSEAVEVLEPLMGEVPARHTVDALPRALLSGGDAWRPPDEPQKRRWWGRLAP